MTHARIPKGLSWNISIKLLHLAEVQTAVVINKDRNLSACGGALIRDSAYRINPAF